MSPQPFMELSEVVTEEKEGVTTAWCSCGKTRDRHRKVCGASPLFVGRSTDDPINDVGTIPMQKRKEAWTMCPSLLFWRAEY